MLREKKWRIFHLISQHSIICIIEFNVQLAVCIINIRIKQRAVMFIAIFVSIFFHQRRIDRNPLKLKPYRYCLFERKKDLCKI